jgi:dinuclear metal center YbgI/SA1388 family protein
MTELVVIYIRLFSRFESYNYAQFKSWAFLFKTLYYLAMYSREISVMNNYAFLAYLDKLLQPSLYQDYCPNGLQVEGQSEVHRIVTGVSLTERLIDVALERQANAILVHHGLFWHKESYAVVGIKKQRLAKLINNAINLYAYHLPLDNHATLGNNIQLAKKLDIVVDGQLSQQNLVWFGHFANPINIDELEHKITNKLGRKPQIFTASDSQQIKTVAWCTGGADSFFMEAIKLGVDAYISGEVSEPIPALAYEGGVSYIAAGHYATERYGIMALGEYISQELQIPTEFIELYNPV